MAAPAPQPVPPSLGDRIGRLLSGLVMRGIAAGSGASLNRLRAVGRGEPTVVRIDFRYDMPEDAFVHEMEALSAFLASVPGLIWKVWSYDHESKLANGTYLFETPEAARFYVEEIFVQGPPSQAGYADFDIRQLRVLEAASRMTRAPLDHVAT